MVHKEHLYRQADALHTRLNASVYHVLCIYARLPYNEPRAYTDPRVVRLKRLITKADARRQRRYREYSRVIRGS